MEEFLNKLKNNSYQIKYSSYQNVIEMIYEFDNVKDRVFYRKYRGQSLFSITDNYGKVYMQTC